VELSTISELMEFVEGQSIVYGEINDDGLHFTLSDGRVLLIVGALAVALLDSENATLQ